MDLFLEFILRKEMNLYIKLSKKDLSQKIFYRMSYTTMDLVISGEIKGRKFDLQLFRLGMYLLM